MATPIREQVLAALESAVQSALANDYVERNRAKEIPAEWPEKTPGTPARYVNLLDGPQQVVEGDTGMTFYRTQVSAEGYVRAASAAAIGPAINALYADLLGAAITDDQLGGLAIDVREGDLSDVLLDGEASQPLAAFELEFIIDYATRPGDPYTLGP